MNRAATDVARCVLLLATCVLVATACSRDEAAAPSPAEAPAATAPAPAQSLGALRDAVGRYPRDVRLFEREPLHGRLVALLGDRMPTLLANMGTQGPVGAEGDVLYVIGNRPHAGGDSQAVLLVDLARDLVHVHLFDEREMAELRERDEEIAWPADVQTTIENWQELAREEP